MEERSHYVFPEEAVSKMPLLKIDEARNEPPRQTSQPTFKEWLYPGRTEQAVLVDRKEFLDLLRTCFAVLAMFSVVIAAISVGMQSRLTEKEYDWRHHKEAQDLLRIWDERTSEHKAFIESFFKRRYRTEKMQQITPEDAAAIRHATAPENDDPSTDTAAEHASRQWWLLKLKITELLNFFEFLSTDCEARIADEDIIRESLGPPMIVWREYLRSYTDLADKESRREVWAPYYRTVATWSSVLERERAALASKSSFTRASQRR
jgi:hypothetical protein